MSNVKFFICRHCGNQVEMIHDAGVPVICCGEPMEELKANTVDASLEKHVPAVTVEGDTVKVQVGSAVHPMLEEHLIEWIYLELENGGSRKALSPGEAPEAVFHTAGVKPVAVYAYCNLHGLWKTEL